MGMRASGAAELEFDDCFVPDNRVVGGLRNGWGLARATLNLSRLPVAAMAVGFAQQAVDIATAWACTQTLAGKPLIHYQQVQAVIADLQAETGAIRALVWQHAKGWTPRQDGAALCKFQATDRAQVVIETAMDLLGSAAILHDNRLERTFRDCRLTRIFEGTNQINRLAVIEDQQAGLLDRIARRAGRAFTGA
jgi:alkylation response protein AidB-like acyl-CoA dehydrogenase